MIADAVGRFASRIDVHSHSRIRRSAVGVIDSGLESDDFAIGKDGALTCLYIRGIVVGDVRTACLLPTQPIGFAVYSRGVDAHECLADYLRQTVLISRSVAPDSFLLVGRGVNAHEIFIALLVVKTIDFAEREHVDGVALVVGSVDARLNKIGARGNAINAAFWLNGQGGVVWLAYISSSSLSQATKLNAHSITPHRTNSLFILLSLKSELTLIEIKAGICSIFSYNVIKVTIKIIKRTLLYLK